ncbi:MAG: phage portal protein [Clostridia bacterium]|nr:phage portal protein [Clostridia bacterium]
MLSEAARLANAIVLGKDRISDEEYILREIRHFQLSQKRKEMLDGERYYCGKHDILTRKREVIGEGGKLQEVDNLPNNRIVDNQYKKMVDQKNNYLLGQPFLIQTDNEPYSKILRKVFNKKFHRLLKSVGEDSLNCGIGWLFIHYDERGELCFKRLRPFEVIPGWKDAEHTILEYAVRVYEVIVCDKKQEKTVQKVEVYDDKGINYFEMSNSGSLKPAEPYFQNYFTITDESGKEIGYNWTKIPLIPFKYNSKEIPLIKMVKTLQDGLNIIESNFQNAMEEDTRNTILVLVNYDGQNLGEFRRNLAQYGAVKVKTVDGSGGDLKSLQVEVNSENYKAILEIFKKAIIENAMGYDAKDDRLNGSPNEMNVQSMYSDIDLDANGMETEFQSAFEELLWFINCHLANIGMGDFENEEVDIIFNRDMLISESSIIDNINKSQDLSLETRLAQHPWVDDVEKEIERINKEKAEATEQYNGAFDFNKVKKSDTEEEV